MDTERQAFTIEYIILAQPIKWAELKRGGKFALTQYAFSQERDRFEVYSKRSWVKCFLETHPDKLEYPIYKLINPLRSVVYPVMEVYSFTI